MRGRRRPRRVGSAQQISPPQKPGALHPAPASPTLPPPAALTCSGNLLAPPRPPRATWRSRCRLGLARPGACAPARPAGSCSGPVRRSGIGDTPPGRGSGAIPILVLGERVGRYCPRRQSGVVERQALLWTPCPEGSLEGSRVAEVAGVLDPGPRGTNRTSCCSSAEKAEAQERPRPGQVQDSWSKGTAWTESRLAGLRIHWTKKYAPAWQRVALTHTGIAGFAG